MDLVAFVKSNLSADEKCLVCLSGTLVQDWMRSPRLIALVTAQGEHGLFIYSSRVNPPQNGKDLIFETAFPVSGDFHFNIVSKAVAKKGGNVPVRITTYDVTLLLELPQDTLTQVFLGEIKNAIALQSQNAGFGLPSTFPWIRKYTPSKTDSNPFVDDIFDPLKQSSGQQMSDSNSGSEVSRLNSGSGWPVNFITQQSRHASLPIIRDTSTYDSSSLGFEDNFADAFNLNGRPSQLMEERISKSRSFEKSLDSLDSRPPPPGLGDDGRPTGREAIVRLVMKERESEYTDIRNFSVCCATWNVNGQAASEVVSPWLACDPEPPDIYAVGFQELDLSKNAFIFSESPREQEWYRRVKEGLHPKAKYKKVKLIRLVGMMLIVFIKEEFVDYLYDVQAETVGTGIMGVMGNKGGVAVRFDIHNTSICFVNSHLAAHTEQFERRNQDFRDINSRMQFTNKNPPVTIPDHEIVFWIGDLNYRISDLDSDVVKNLINQKNYAQLLQSDQLYQQMALKKVFLDYTEGDVNFQPTYKYDTGTDNWDTSEKCRTPAWCDRILWRGPKVKQLSYQSHPVLRLSDHKPVSSIFSVGVKVVDSTKYKRVYEDVMKRLDKWENEFLPQVKLDKTELSFPDGKFIETQTAVITVANTGQVPVQFSFINKPGDTSYCKPWLIAKPSHAAISVGDICEIEIELYVDKFTAPKLNSGDDRIEDILVLHLEGGKDFFISVNGNYLPSCFGSSIETLIQMAGPIRDVPVAQLIDLTHGLNSAVSTPSHERPLDVPKELWRLVDYLYRYGMNQEDLFQQPGLDTEIQQIRDCLDTGQPDKLPGSIASVSETFLIFLESLAEPIIPFSMYSKCLECCNNFILCKQVLLQIPSCHRTVFKYIMAFLRKLLQFSDHNNLDPKFLATVFGGLVLRSPLLLQRQSSSISLSGSSATSNKRAQQQAEEKKKAAFVYHFLINEYDE